MDYALWLYIALAIFVVALIIAIIGVVMLIVGMKEPLKKMKGSANNLTDRMGKLQLETTSLSHNANELKEDMQLKSEKITALIDAGKGTVNSVIDLNASVRAITGNIASRVDHNRDNIAEVNQWSNGAMKLLVALENRNITKRSDVTHSSTSFSDTKNY
ncbi:DUF948 domain-containing protein [Planococcus sp. S3-L1]|uniref:DUF948 domain-containing protein n=1 Tax=Planococcus sp. S3-L1 TaxID=3046200 RepID=UPI0024BA44C5|nr:DUF948 domain-containing protein [Planococcus sp. S3-L1]MDJ0331299.1 DUF948 domain-containing protein [Planococcus sp. S3-L1]